MGEIISQWIEKRTGINLDLEAKSIVDYLKDGKILEHLLLSYDIICDDISSSPDQEKVTENLTKVMKTLNPIDACFNEQIVNNIVDNNDNSIALKLLYHLYLILNDDKKVNYLKTLSKPQDEDLCEKSTIETSKYRKVMENFKQAREKYLNYLKELADKEQIKPEVKIEIELDSLDLQSQIINNPIFIKIKKKRRDKERQKNFQVEMQRLLLQELWERILSKEEKEVKESLLNVLKEKAKYERQIIMKDILLEEQQMKPTKEKKKPKTTKAEVPSKIISASINLSGEGEEESLELLNSYYEQKNKMLDLHRKLYTYKKCLKREKNWNMCKHIIKDVADMALLYSQYKQKYGTDVPSDLEKEIMDYFQKNIPISELLEKVDDELYFTPSQIIDTYEPTKITHWEQRDLEDYLNLEEDFQTESIPELEIGINILGHVVNWLLQSEWIQEKSEQAPLLKKARPAACIIGLEVFNGDLLQLLEKMLKQRRVHLIYPSVVVEFCINAYKKETVAEIAVQKEEKEKNEIETKKSKNPGKEDKNQKGGKEPEIIEEKTKSKFVQTPNFFPDEVVKLTKKAELGMIAKKSVELEEELPESILAQMLIEYLKTLPNISGWVLIDFPKKIYGAMALEQCLTGKPGALQIEMETSNKNHSHCLISNTSCDLERLFYKTYLTAFIKLEMKNEQDGKNSYNDNSYHSPIDYFYMKRGCFYSFVYKSFDFDTVKKLGRLILGDPSLPPKPSVEMFGESIKLLQEEKKLKDVVSSKKGAKEKEAKAPKEDKKKAKIESNEPVTYEDKEVQVPEVMEVVYEEAQEQSPRPGEKDWLYVSIETPYLLNVALCTLWNNIEETYLDDLKQLFFFQRIIFNTVCPYFDLLKSRIRSYLSCKDSRQEYLEKFQQGFNAFEEEMREDNGLKEELHCLLSEFRKKMFEICDNRMIQVENQRKKAIMNCLEVEESCQLGNIYINMMQVELDRCGDTLLFLTDYYVAVITKKPYKEKFPRKEILQKIETRKDAAFSKILDELLNFLLKNTSTNPLLEFLQKTLNTSLPLVQNYNSFVQTAIEKLQCDVDKLFTNCEKRKVEFGEPEEMVKKSLGRIFAEWRTATYTEISRVNFRLNLIFEVANKKITNYLRNVQEFYNGLLDEIAAKYNNEVESIEQICELFYRAVEAEVPLLPKLELKNGILTADPKNYLCLPVKEAGPSTIAEIKYDFFDDRNTFTISQLNSLITIFYDVAPTGIISHQVFLYVLQDVASHNIKNKLLPHLWTKLQPHQIEDLVCKICGPSNLIDWKNFMVQCFHLPFPSEEELLETRARFRNIDKELTENISEIVFYKTPLWYENHPDLLEPQQCLYYGRIKTVLARIYKIDETNINYSALLLAFCKDRNPAAGLGKALALCVGKKVCWGEETGAKFLEYWEVKWQEEEEQRLKSMEEHEYAEREAGSVISELIDHTVHVCDSVVIEEVVSQVLLQEIISEEVLEDQMEKEEEMIVGECEGENLSKCSDLFFRKFSNVEIGFESSDLPYLMYFLPLEVLTHVLSIALHWPEERDEIEFEDEKNVKVLYETLKREKFNFSVLTHEVLNCCSIYKLCPSIYCQFKINNVNDLIESFFNEN